MTTADELRDVTWACVPKSDQINADDLVSGPMDVQVVGTTAYTGEKGERRIAIRLEGHDRVWRPCKTVARILVAAWGKDSHAWVGRWVRLYRDDAVAFGGVQVGGIRVSHMSHLAEPLSVALSTTKGKRSMFRVLPMPQPAGVRLARPDLATVIQDAELVEADVDRWRVSQGKGPVADLTDAQRAQLAGWLAADPTRLDAIRALIPTAAPQGEE